ncbi:MAG: NFACT family protein [Clostridia bacterium]|nr:NFACT family protein [Clostridia bacterium]
MAMDSITVRALTMELNELLSGGRIDKIYQPERGEIIIGVRSNGVNYKLLLCANPSFPRVHITETKAENPASPPMLCMLLRKHLSAGKILKVYQHSFERVIKIDIESRDELGELSVKTLIAEIMGKHSNIILVDQNGKIIDSIYHVDITVSSVRQILPGLMYENPPSQGKASPLAASAEDVAQNLDDDSEAARSLVNKYMGISPLAAREIVYRATGSAEVVIPKGEISVKEKIAVSFCEVFDKVKSAEFVPQLILNTENKSLMDFSPLNINQYENMAKSVTFETMSEAVERFFVGKATAASLKQKSADLTKVVSINLDRCRKKLQIENETIAKAEKREKYKVYGDLLMANLYMIERGAKQVTLDNFYSEQGEQITIPLKEDQTAAQNAQRYYARYNKEKTAYTQTVKQREINLAEIDYLESVAEAISKSETGDEIKQIRDELAEQGYVRLRGIQKRKKEDKPTPMHFISSDGYDIYVGKNNKQNDYVTLKLSRPTDIWLHTKEIHGSHVLVKTDDAMTVPDRTYEEAGILAAYYSRGRGSASVPVDYTEVYNVKKPSGAKPGMVIYVDYSTMYVTPEQEIVEKLEKNNKI